LTYRAFFDRPRSQSLSYKLQSQDRERTTAFDREIPAHYIAFDALRSFDLPQLLACSPAMGMIVNPIDGDWNVLAEPAARRLLGGRLGLVSQADPEQVRRELRRWLAQVTGE
jgi:hypothetical protein